MLYKIINDCRISIDGISVLSFKKDDEVEVPEKAALLLSDDVEEITSESLEEAKLAVEEANKKQAEEEAKLVEESKLKAEPEKEEETKILGGGKIIKSTTKKATGK